MTGSPPPSGRSESAKSALFALFRPVLLVATALGLTGFVIALTLGALAVLHHRAPPPETDVGSTPIAIPAPEPEPPPITVADFKGFPGIRGEARQAAATSRPTRSPPQ